MVTEPDFRFLMVYGTTDDGFLYRFLYDMKYQRANRIQQHDPLWHGGWRRFTRESYFGIAAILRAREITISLGEQTQD